MIELLALLVIFSLNIYPEPEALSYELFIDC